MTLRDNNAPYRAFNKDLRKIFIYKVNGEPDLIVAGWKMARSSICPGERKPAVLY